MLVKNPKLAIIVPYRNREEHLARFVPHMEEFLSDKDIEYKIFVIEQDNDKPFNRGWLLNVGFEISQKQGYDYFCFHDIDMLPEDNSCDYSWVEKPTHLASRLSKFRYRLVYAEYIGGVTLFNKEHFTYINGFSNKYWGWGFEDDDLLYRCRKASLPLKQEWVGRNKTTKSTMMDVMEFSGRDYCEIPLSTSISKTLDGSFTMEAWVKPSDDLILDDNKNYDEFHIFTRPGHHTGLAFTSGMQYKASIWDKDEVQHMVVSDRKNIEWCHVVFVADYVTKRLKMYVNGQEVNNSPKDFFSEPRVANIVPYFIGCANPNARHGDQGFFKGSVAQITLWKTPLNPLEIKTIFNNGMPYISTKQKNYTGWKSGSEPYKSAKEVVGYWDFDNVVSGRIIDKSGNDNHAIIKGGFLSEEDVQVGSEVLIPYRRDGKFLCLEHEENGWSNTKYVHQESRQNQIFFFNKVRRGLEDYKKDGLSSLTYQINNKEKFLEKHEFISVT